MSDLTKIQQSFRDRFATYYATDFSTEDEDADALRSIRSEFVAALGTIKKSFDESSVGKQDFHMAILGFLTVLAENSGSMDDVKFFDCVAKVVGEWGALNRGDAEALQNNMPAKRWF